MCERASFLVWYNGNIDWDLNDDDHSSLILRGTDVVPLDHHTQPYVKVECTPRADPFSRDRNDWTVVVDEDDNPPLWFDQDDWEGKILDELVNKRIPKELETGIIGSLVIPAGQDKTYDWIVQAGKIKVMSGAKVSMPKLALVETLMTFPSSAVDFPELRDVTNCFFVDSYTAVSMPKCTHIRYLAVDPPSTIELPSVTEIDEIIGKPDGVVKLPKCTKIHVQGFSVPTIEAPLLQLGK